MREIDSKGLELCDEQGRFFQRSIELFDGSSSNFIKVFMKSKPAKTTDRFNFFDSGYVYLTLRDNNPSLNTKGTIKYGEKEMYWIGYIYRYWSYTYKWPSSKVFDIVQGTTMHQLYETYHSLDPAVVINRIMEAKNKKEETALNVLKRIYSM